MKSSNDDHKKLSDLLDKFKQELKSDEGEMQHELSELLAGADRDLRSLKDSTPQDVNGLKTFSNQMQALVVKFKSEHPRLSRIAQEFVDHFNHMGI